MCEAVREGTRPRLRENEPFKTVEEVRRAAKPVAPPPVPAEDLPLLLATFSAVEREVFHLLYTVRLGIRAAAKARGVKPPTIVQTRKRVDAKLAAAKNARANTRNPKPPPVKETPMPPKKIGVKAGDVSVYLCPVRSADHNVYAATSQTLLLSGPQAILLARLHEALVAGGVQLPQQSDAVGWILDRFADQLRDEPLIEAYAYPEGRVCAVCGAIVTEQEFFSNGPDGVRKIGPPGITLAHLRHFAADVPAADRAANEAKLAAAYNAARTVGTP
jgi:hypothetical protein